MAYHPLKRSGISSRLCRVYHQQLCCWIYSFRLNTLVLGALPPCSVTPSEPRSNLRSLACASTDSLRLIIIREGGIYSKPSPVGEGGIRAFASMTDEVFAFSSSNFPCGIPYPDTSSTASGPLSPTGEGFLKSMRKHRLASLDFQYTAEP